MTTKLLDYFPADEIENVKEIVKELHGQLLLNKKIGAPNLALLVIYMLSNRNKANSVSEKDAVNFFEETGCGSSTDFSKVLYELTKRDKSNPCVIKKGEMLSLTFAGLSKVKELISGESK
ncbi:MAG: hypothetical protein NT130_04575 [Candidatus Micrarchaeota archaeon]|nr:hypothetical protein [Candidatus Micrarchaeota archaeon]